MLTLIGGSLLVAIALILPGVLLVQALDDGDLVWRVALGAGVGLLVVPFFAFLLAWALHTSVSAWLLLLTSALISAPLWWWARR